MSDKNNGKNDHDIDSLYKLVENINRRFENSKPTNNKFGSLVAILFSFLLLLSIITVIWQSFNVEQQIDKGNDELNLLQRMVKKKKPLIGEIIIEGPIGFRTVRLVSSKLRGYSENENVYGVIFRINSPGGTVGASQEIYDAIIKFKETEKPIYSSVGDIAASGAYYIASATDKIFANRGSTVGSIGVIISNYNLKKIADKIGIDMVTVKSGKYKDLISPFKEPVPEELEILQNQVDAIYNQFINDILLVRKDKIKRKELIEYAQGQIYIGKRAKEIGLIDELGNYQNCFETMKKTIGEDDIELDHERRTIFDSLKELFGGNQFTKIRNINTEVIDYLVNNELRNATFLLVYPGAV